MRYNKFENNAHNINKYRKVSSSSIYDGTTK